MGVEYGVTNRSDGRLCHPRLRLKCAFDLLPIQSLELAIRLVGDLSAGLFVCDECKNCVDEHIDVVAPYSLVGSSLGLVGTHAFTPESSILGNHVGTFASRQRIVKAHEDCPTSIDVSYRANGIRSHFVDVLIYAVRLFIADDKTTSEIPYKPDR